MPTLLARSPTGLPNRPAGFRIVLALAKASQSDESAANTPRRSPSPHIGQTRFAIGKGAVRPCFSADERGKNSYHELNRARTGSTTIVNSGIDSRRKSLVGIAESSSCSLGSVAWILSSLGLLRNAKQRRARATTRHLRPILSRSLELQDPRQSGNRPPRRSRP